MANSRNTAKVILRKQTITAAGTATVALQVFVGGDRKIISLGIYVKPDEFDEDRKKITIKGDKQKSALYTTLINAKEARAEKIFINAEINEESLTLERFLELFDTKTSRQSFTTFVNKDISILEKDKKNKSTIGDYRLMLNYAHESAKTKNINFSDIDFTFIERFETFLKKKKLSVNTAAKHHKNLKKYINLAIAKGVKLQSPYGNFKVKKAKTLRDWLTPDELEALFNLYNSRSLSGEWQRVLRYFLFSCVCGGFRISELKILEDANKVGENIVVYTQKGSNYERCVIIPFSDVGLDLWKDRQLLKQPKKVFDCISDQNSNIVIKKVARIAGIEKNVTMHVARHTFATNYIIFGGRIEMLNDILGHSKIETTMIYLHMAEAYKQKGEQMKNFDRFFRVEKKKVVPIVHKIAS